MNTAVIVAAVLIEISLLLLDAAFKTRRSP